MRVNEGQCVLLNYRTFEGVENLGLFMVLYHEATDKKNSNNFIDLKIYSPEY